jgi:hypothetical protein
MPTFSSEAVTVVETTKPPDEVEPQDVAISLLIEDLPLGREIVVALSPEFSVFLFERAQVEISGTDGLATFREVYTQCKVAVILYRPRWGQTDWTRAEEEILKDRYLRQHADSIAVVSLDETALAPEWYPEHRLTHSLKSLGSSGVIAALRRRCSTRGATPSGHGAISEAQRIARREQIETERLIELTRNGVSAVQSELRTLFEAMKAKADEASQILKAPGVTFSLGPFQHHLPPSATIGRGRTVILVHWLQDYVNEVQKPHAVLLVREQYRQVPLPVPQAWETLRDRRYAFEFLHPFGWVWQEEGGPPIKSVDLADVLVTRLLRLAEERERE